MDRALSSGLCQHTADGPGVGSQEDCAAGNTGPIPERSLDLPTRPGRHLPGPPACPAASPTSKSGAAAALLRRVSTAAHRFYPTEVCGQLPGVCCLIVLTVFSRVQSNRYSLPKGITSVSVHQDTLLTETVTMQHFL